VTSIVEKFGGKRRQEPSLPVPTLAHPAVPPTAQDSAQALAFINSLNDEVVVLREENAQLRADLNLCRLRCSDLEKDRDADRMNLEQYRRYAVESRTYFQTIADVAARGNDRGLETPSGDSPPIDIATAEIAAKYGAGNAS